MPLARPLSNFLTAYFKASFAFSKSLLLTATSTFFKAVLTEDLNEALLSLLFSLVKLRLTCCLP